MAIAEAGMRVRRAGEALTAPPLIFLAAALLLRAPAFPAAVLDPDEGLYILQAQAWLAGGWPYLAVWDMHPPGAPALLAPVLALVHDPVLALRLAGVLAVAATATGLHAIARLLGAGGRTALAAGLLYVAHGTMPGGLATNTEILFAPFVTLAAWLLLAEAQRGAARPGRVLAAGFAIGAALLVKQLAALEGAALFLTLAALAPRRLALHAALFALGAGAPTLAVAAGYALAGQGEAWLQANLLAPLAYAGVDPVAPGLRRGLAIALPALSGLALACAGLAFEDAPARRAGRWLLPWLLGAALAVVLPWRFYDHHFLVLLPPLSLLAAFGLASIARHALRPSLARRGFVLLLALLLALPAAAMLLPRLAGGFGLRAEDPVRQAARIAAASLAPGEALFVANWHPMAYALARATPPTRFAFPEHLSGEAARLTGADAPAELARVLALPPGVILVAPGGWARFRPDARAAVEAALARYDRVAIVPDGAGGVEVWRRR